MQAAEDSGINLVVVDEDGEAPERGADEGISPPQLPPMTPRGDGSVLPPLTEDIIALVSHGEDPPPPSLRHLAPGFMLDNEVGGRYRHKTQNTKHKANRSISHQ